MTKPTKPTKPTKFTPEELKKAYLCILESFGCATSLDPDEPISQVAIEEVYRQNNKENYGRL